MQRKIFQWQDACNNPHLWLLLFSVGVTLLRFFSQLPSLLLPIVALLMLLPFAVRYLWLRPVAALAVGFCWSAVVATVMFGTTIPAAMEKKDVVISGQVIGAPLATDRYQRFDFQVEQLMWRGTVYPSPGKIRLKLYQNQPQILSGQQWRFTARLKQARGYHNPGALFDYEAYLFHHHLRATGYVRNHPPPLLLKAQSSFSIAAFRQRVAGFIRTSLNDSEQAGLVAALVVGIRNDMNQRTWEVLLRTGTIHLVAISGLHIGLVSGLALLLGSWCWRFAGALPLRVPAPKVGVLIGLLAGLIYALLAGMTIPTQRAVCMLAVVAAAMFFQRRPFGTETLVIALAVVLAVDPLATLSAGLWLSFGAVVILVLGVTRTRQHLSDTQASASFNATATTDATDAPNATDAINLARKFLHKLGAWSAIQIGLFVGMAPLLLALFHRVSLVAPLANLVAVPVIGMIAVPVALLGLILYFIGLEDAAVLAFQCALWIIEWLWVLLEWLSASDWSVWQQPSPPLWSLPLAAVGVCLLLSPGVFPARWSGLVWLLPLFSVTPNVPAAGEFRYTMLEVGHGLASVVQTRNHLLVYDAGPRFKGGLDAGQTVVVPFLQQLDADTIDEFIISHGDNDHIGGHRAVLKRFKVKRILTSVPASIPTSQPCHAGQSWVWDEVRFEMLWPSLQIFEGDITNENDASCVLKVSSEFGSILLTGDIGKPAERALANSGRNLAADVLQAPHHGSKTSSTEVFLSRVQPSIALASIGYLNRYGHPHEVVAKRYARRQIPVYKTADEGAITASFTATGIIIRGHRGSIRKYWQQPAVQLNSAIRIESR